MKRLVVKSVFLHHQCYKTKNDTFMQLLELFLVNYSILLVILIKRVFNSLMQLFRHRTAVEYVDAVVIVGISGLLWLHCSGTTLAQQSRIIIFKFHVNIA